MRRGRILPRSCTKALQHLRLFVINEIDLIDAEATHFLLAEILPLALCVRQVRRRDRRLARPPDRRRAPRAGRLRTAPSAAAL